MATVGFVGLGVMGGTVTKRLLDAGHTVHGYNRTREKAQWLVERGLILEDTPRAVAEQADVIFSMVTNTKALDAVARGPGRDPRRAEAGPGLGRLDHAVAVELAPAGGGRRGARRAGCSTRRSRARP